MDEPIIADQREMKKRSGSNDHQQDKRLQACRAGIAFDTEGRKAIQINDATMAKPKDYRHRRK